MFLTYLLNKINPIKNFNYFIWDNKYYTTKGLDDDGLGGYPTKNPKPPKYYHDPKAFTNKYTDFVEGKRRFDEDLENQKVTFVNVFISLYKFLVQVEFLYINSTFDDLLFLISRYYLYYVPTIKH